MKKKEFLADVVHEVQALRTHATSEELDNLYFEIFDPNRKTKCIYGQMSGSCTSSRAKVLMDLSCKRVWNLNKNLASYSLIRNPKFTEVKKFINGQYTGQGWHTYDHYGNEWNRDLRYISALEGYIFLKDAKVKHIFEYLTGKVEKLEL
jgi:hypothetical protein